MSIIPQHLCLGVYSFLLSVHSSFCHVENLHQNFTLKFLQANHLVESIHIWTLGTLEGLLPFHKFWPQGSCPGVGLEVKNWDTLKKYYTAFSFMLTPSKAIMSVFSHQYGMGFCALRWRSVWPIFHGWVILPSTMDLEDYLITECHTWDNGSVWYKDWPHKVYVGQWPIFLGPAILLNILKAIWWRNVILGIKDQCNTKIDLIKYVGQWPVFCSPVTLLNILKTIIMLEDCRTYCNGSVWHKYWPYKVTVGQWPIICGPVTLPYILKTVSWRNVILVIMDKCDTKIYLIKYR